jgi:TDG/mug DNA glycosylase family protein
MPHRPRPSPPTHAPQAAPLRPLRDIIPRPRSGPSGLARPRLLLVGINPSLRSAEVGHHFAGPGNPFWRLLYAAGLVTEPIGSTEDRRLIDWGLALTNLCPRPTRSAAELRPEEMTAGRAALARKIARLRPDVVCFVGVTLYQAFFGGRGRKTGGGPGPKPERITGARVYVVPNPSGLNASFPGFEHKLVWYRRLREFLETPDE